MKTKVTIITLILITALVLSCVGSTPKTSPPSSDTTQEIEAASYNGVKLTPIKDQLNNALNGTQYIDRAAYRLTVNGLVNKPLSLSYDDLLAFPQEVRLNTFNCVEGWNFVAKWTGPTLDSIFDTAGLKPEGKIAIFYTTDDSFGGYTSLYLNYIHENQIIIALKNNDITLPPERGFPFQVVAQSKFGYKWAKWVNRIEISDNTSFRGYWESAGYNNEAYENGPAFER
jgi:DMSO/TMAO reductase YedYZ molybdopterin-dependent catalytic subunit